MNTRIRELVVEARNYALDEKRIYERVHNTEQCMEEYRDVYNKKFAELIVQECLAQVARVDDMLEDEPAQHAAVAWVARSIADHFGVAKPQSDWDQAAAEFIAAEDKKVASRYGYVPKLHPSEWKD
jgi:3'-phosphoadenosine 5'-phosphosulfate (PAPS) 3'-phosphatase